MVAVHTARRDSVPGPVPLTPAAVATGYEGSTSAPIFRRTACGQWEALRLGSLVTPPPPETARFLA